MKSRDMDTESEDTTPGRDSWRSARGRETVLLTTPRTRGRGKRRMERGGGTTKRPRMESLSSSERRDESEESRSGGTRDRPGRGGRRAARPMTPPHRPPPPCTSPRRSPRLSKSSGAGDLGRLSLSAKIDRRTAHSQSVSGDEHGRGPSRSSRSLSDHGGSGQGRQSRSREPTPPQLMNFSIDDFTVVSFTFTSAHPFFPGWVQVVGAHRSDRVQGTPCSHNPEEELQAKKRVRLDVEPPEVRRFLRQELLRKVVHSWWNRPRVYRHDLADERESTPSVRSVVVIPSDPNQPEASPEQQGLGPSGSSDRMTLVGPVASLITSLPCTPGQDILLPGDAEESPRSRKGLVAAATLEQEMGRRSVAAAIRPIKDRAVASSSSATEPITQKTVAEACDTLIREKHPASPPVLPEGSEPPTQSDQDRPRGTGILQEPPLPRRKTASTPRPERGRSPMGAEQGPEPAMFSPSAVVRQETPSSLRTHVAETEESGSDTRGEPEDRRGMKEEPPHLVA